MKRHCRLEKANLKKNTFLHKEIKLRDKIIEDLLEGNIKVEKAASLDMKLNPGIARFSEENTFDINDHHVEVDVRKQ